MCGIVGAVADRDIVPILIEGLRRLEYRGYDSAGVAVLNGSGEVQRRRTVGKVRTLQDALDSEPAHGGLGIAHTRWATHGGVTEINAHPHTDDRNPRRSEKPRLVRQSGLFACPDGANRPIAHG